METKHTKEHALEKAQEHANNYGLKRSEFTATLIQFGSECYLKAIEDTAVQELLEALIGMVEMYESELKPIINIENGIMRQSLAIAKRVIKSAHGTVTDSNGNQLIETNDFYDGVRSLSKALIKSKEFNDVKQAIQKATK